jgi:RNA 2',3'-cyclic 3'-phosphodiesterase
MPRLFTGLELPPDVASQLCALQGGLPGAKWIDPGDYHVTLRFLGDIDVATANDIADALGEVPPRSVTVTLDRLSAFGNEKPRAVIARALASDPLVALQLEHERLARQAGLPPEARKFTPHVTLARLRGATAADVARYIETHGEFRPLTFEATRFVLYSSRSSRGGGPYRVEVAYPP